MRYFNLDESSNLERLSAGFLMAGFLTYLVSEQLVEPSQGKEDKTAQMYTKAWSRPIT
jgi:hypothetical protein